MSKSELKLPEQVSLLRFDDPEQLCDALAERIGTVIRTATADHEQASIALSGGRTPVPLFERLSRMALPWQDTLVTLADDRWVATEEADSNEGLLKRHLLHGHAAAARFIGLWLPQGNAHQMEEACAERLAQLPDQLDLVVLGMGNDGHTASLFPCSEDLGRALETDRSCCAVTPTSAPHERMTLSAARLLASRERILHLKGEDKLETLQQVLAGDDIREMPIRLFLQRPLTIYWSR
ncbi:6-phosphogluconolactonase [Marinobacterium aestuariivivens]|uniref:6-phosphogluconolactonase n=1 Tax=Marinobacterium aestuariivivens TaxID=1698799 RepID=A0ABW2A8W5_9GAMM